MVRKPRLGFFFLIDFLILVFEFGLIMILGSGSVSVKDVQTYLYNLIEAEPEPKFNRASDTDNADDVNNNNNTENAENAENADDTDDTDDADDAENAENADYWSVPSPYHVTWPISRLPGPISFIYMQHPLSIVLKSNTPTRINYKRQIG